MKTLPKIIKKSQKRVGRGYGSGKGGHTVGKGQKGQKTRKSLSILFEGQKMKKSFIKKLPFKRGKGKFSPSKKPVVLPLEALNIFANDQMVSVESLLKLGVVSKEAKTLGVKVLGKGNIEKSLTISVPISNSAAKKVEKAGGKVELNVKKVEDKVK